MNKKYNETGRTFQTLSLEEKNALSALSKEVFGASSKWQKLIKDGKMEAVVEEVTEYVPDDGEGTTRQVNVQTKVRGSQLYRNHRYTVDEVEHFMKDLKERHEMIQKLIKEQQDKQAALSKEAERKSELLDTVNSLGSGSVL